MKIILSVLLLIGLSIGAYAKPIILGKDQAPINTHNYEVLKRVAKNAGIPVEKFKHYTRRNDQFIIGPEGYLYWDRKKNGVIDGEDEAVFGAIARLGNSYITDRLGNVVAISIRKSEFNDTNILNSFSEIVAIYLYKNKIKKINISNLNELRLRSFSR